MNELEEKIKTKGINLIDGYIFRQTSGGHSPQNKETFLTDLTASMLKIIKAEVNIRLQEIRRLPKATKLT